MATRTTRWSPDTCGCVIEYGWDDSLPPDQRIHALANVVSRCAAHAGFSGQAHLDQLVAENSRKNRVHGTILEKIPALKQTVTDPVTGHTSTMLRDGVTLSWSFDANRHLTVAVEGASATQRRELQARVDDVLGQGVVTIA